MEEKSFTHGVTLHKDGTYALQLNIDFGYMTPDDLITLGEIAKKYGVTCCAATTAKKISLMNVKEEDVNKVWAEVDVAFAKSSYARAMIFANLLWQARITVRSVKRLSIFP